MQISAGSKGVDESAIAGKLGEDSQFNLRIVGNNKLAAFRMSRKTTQVLHRMWHLLNIGIRAGKPTGRRADLTEVSVQAVGSGIDQFDHVLTITRQCLLHRTVFK